MSNEIEVELNDELDLQEPKKYNVFLLNDDYSTMDFVIDVLVRIFRKSTQDATEIIDRKSTRLNSSHSRASRMPSSA